MEIEEEVLRAMIKLYSETHTETVNATENLRYNYGKLKRLAEQEAPEEKILRVHAKLHGEVRTGRLCQ